MNTRVRFRATVGCIALAVLITPALLFAHARLVRSAPAVNATVSEPPVSISLWFSERPELRFTTLELVDSAGRVIPHGPITSIDSMGVTASINTTLAPGRYSIAWRTAAADAHGTSGRFGFIVARAGAAAITPGDTINVVTIGANANAPIQTGGPSGFSLSVRWAELIAAITLIGAVVFRLFVLPRAEFPEAAFRDAADRTRNLAGAVLLLFVIAAAMRFRAALEMMPATPLTGPGALGIGALMSGAWALAWLVVFAGAVIVMLSLFVARRSVIGWFLAILGITTICAGEALTGHAGSLANNGSIGVVADVAHFLGAGGWIGGLACVVLCGLPAVRVAEPVLRDVAASRLVRAYHRLAFECVVVVLVSAVIAALLRLNAISDLWTTAYGSLLFRKIIFVLVVLGLGTYHWRAVVIPDWDPKTARRFRWTAAIELIVGAVVIAFTTFLVSTALPNHP